MSERSTIAVCYNGRIIDDTFYMNVGIGRLLIEAFRTYEKYRDCESEQVYLNRKIQERKMIDPTYIYDKEMAEEFLKLDQMASEFQLIVDFTERCIYKGFYAKQREKLLSIPDSRSMMATLTRKQQYEFTTDDFIDFTLDSIFWMDKLPVKELLELSKDNDVFSKYYW
ncbi:hypothetical protein [uncultured Ruminococcus sp.]|uniref:hypothetical protein n=1 Tax=uncultured Ruminococcus sp. TaxID=165186 RepID=UPI0025F31358|nr:hypothetical protein [uncultured Ruminococcus sp.]